MKLEETFGMADMGNIECYFEDQVYNESMGIILPKREEKGFERDE